MSNRITTTQPLVDDSYPFNDNTLRATRAYARTKPWRGTLEERLKKLNTFHAALCGAHGIEPQLVVAIPNDHEGGSGSSGASSHVGGRMTLVNRVSVASYLWIFARAMGLNRREAFRWSLSLFKRCFPISFGRCRLVGCMLIR